MIIIYYHFIGKGTINFYWDIADTKLDENMMSRNDDLFEGNHRKMSECVKVGELLLSRQRIDSITGYSTWIGKRSILNILKITKICICWT